MSRRRNVTLCVETQEVCTQRRPKQSRSYLTLLNPLVTLRCTTRHRRVRDADWFYLSE